MTSASEFTLFMEAAEDTVTAEPECNPLPVWLCPGSSSNSSLRNGSRGLQLLFPFPRGRVSVLVLLTASKWWGGYSTSSRLRSRSLKSAHKLGSGIMVIHKWRARCKTSDINVAKVEDAVVVDLEDANLQSRLRLTCKKTTLKSEMWNMYYYYLYKKRVTNDRRKFENSHAPCLQHSSGYPYSIFLSWHLPMSGANNSWPLKNGRECYQPEPWFSRSIVFLSLFTLFFFHTITVSRFE